MKEMFLGHKEWVILGVTESGEPFNVPDWQERLCGMLADQARNNRLIYSDYLKPIHIDGYPSVVMSSRLADDDPVSYLIVEKFVAENGLQSRAGRVPVGDYPHQERRNYVRG